MIKVLLTTILLHSMIYAGDITIAVSANVSYAIDKLKAEFAKTNPQTTVRVVLGSSGKLTAQIKHGASYMIFLSANMLYPNRLYTDKVAITKPIIYAKGALALITTKDRDLSNIVTLMQSKDIDKIAIANPKTAPYGIATKEALENLKIYKTIKHKLIYGESISQTVSYAITATDLGIIAKSSLHSPNMKRFEKGKNWIDINPKLYTPINQGIVLLKSARDNQEAKAFYDFMLSDRARDVLVGFGYIYKDKK